MFKWLTNKNSTYTKMAAFNSAICFTYQDILKDNFKQTMNLQKIIKDIQKNQDTNFICAEACDNDHVCHVCFQPLVGPCSTFSCDGCHTVHEGCMFKLWLAGYTECPMCIREKNDLNIKFDINYPTTLSITKIRDNFNKISTNDKINIETLLKDVKKNKIVNPHTLSSIYR